jgi:hypothetical protein
MSTFQSVHRPKTFRFYLGGFAKDAKACYSQGRNLTGANPETFRALNYCYASDGVRAWCIGGEFKDCDGATFEVLDDGDYDLGVRNLRAPYGYAKDATQVWYYSFDGKPNLVKKAEAATFRVLGNQFAMDTPAVYAAGTTIRNADPKT